MNQVRIIPVLLLDDKHLVKSVKFKKHVYVGDPINVVKIFNEKEVDEIVILDISATANRRRPNLALIKEIAEEAFMPMAYGGGISTIDEMKVLVCSGVEKVVINSAAYKNQLLVEQAAKALGSQSVVVSVDVNKNLLGQYRVFIENGSKNSGLHPLDYMKRMEELGAGEFFINCIYRDGTYAGYDLELIQMLSKDLKIPLIICGGASSTEDFKNAINSGASAVAAGSMFIFQRPHNAVLISYPSREELFRKLYTNVQ